MHIRRIRQDEAERVTALWDAACREVVDGGPLRPRGRRSIAAMLTLSAHHPSAACLVAERDGELVGFVVAELEQGLLPGLLGRVAELHVVPAARAGDEAARALVEGAQGWLRERGAGVVYWEVPEDEAQRLALAHALGWQREAIRFATYPR